MKEKMKNIAAARGLKLHEAYREMGTNYWAVGRVARGEFTGSREFWESLIRWSEGKVTPDDAFRDVIDEAKNGKGKKP